MLSKKNLKDYIGQIVKINFKNDSGYIAGVLEKIEKVLEVYYLVRLPSGWNIPIVFGAIKDFEVINEDALEKSQKRLQKANGRKLNGNGKIKKVLYNTKEKHRRSH